MKPINRMKCPHCDEHWLEFEMVGAGIRVVRETDGKKHYNCRCDKCGDFKMETPQ